MWPPKTNTASYSSKRRGGAACETIDHSSSAWPAASMTSPNSSARTRGPCTIERMRIKALKQRPLRGRRLDRAGRLDAGLVEQSAQHLRAPRRVVVAVVVEHRVDLVCLLGQASDRFDPFLEVLASVQPVEPLAGRSRFLVPRLPVAAVKAKVRDVVRRRSDAGQDVRGPSRGGIDRHVRKP